jgi:O-methyltransferase involved in polyketide biosynthesis
MEKQNNREAKAQIADRENKAGLHGQTVQSTMLLAIYGRAKASRMFPDIMRDDEAIRIVDGMDYDFTQIDKSYATEYGSLCCLLRAKRLDERCLAYLRGHPNGTVVNLGSGLDTTFSRVDNGEVRWYNLDLPDAMAFRHRFIPAARRGGDIEKSMFDYTWLNEVETAGVFILAGGLFYYFEESRLRELITRIAEHFPRGELFFGTVKNGRKDIQPNGTQNREQGLGDAFLRKRRAKAERLVAENPQGRKHPVFWKFAEGSPFQAVLKDQHVGAG